IAPKARNFLGRILDGLRNGPLWRLGTLMVTKDKIGQPVRLHGGKPGIGIIGRDLHTFGIFVSGCPQGKKIQAMGKLHRRTCSCVLSAGGALPRLVRLAGGRDKFIRLVSEHQETECEYPAVFYLMKFDSHWDKGTKIMGKGPVA